MSFIGSISTPFDNFDTDSQTIDNTGAALSAVFTNLTVKTQREFLLRNDGNVNLLIGKTLAAARYPILPGDALKLAGRDLAKIFAKAASGSVTAVIIQIL